MRRTRRALSVLLAALALALLPAATASAHPLGNFTVNTADRIVVNSKGVDLLHVVDLAEIPTVQLKGAITAVGGLTPYAAAECARVLPLLDLEVDGRPAALAVAATSGEVLPGAAGLTTTRLECHLTTGQHATAGVTFRDGAVSDRVGWKEVTIATECGSLVNASVPAVSRSKLLTAYPADLLTSPLDVRAGQAGVRTGRCTAGARDDTSVVTRALPRGAGGVAAFFTDFLGRKHLTVGFAIASILASLAFGVLHALAPGHGKTVMAAYLVGQRGTRRQALQLGSIVTFTHTASVLLLGALLTLGTLAAPERVVPATEVLSGLLLAGLGIYLLVLAVRKVRGGRAAGQLHDHGHDHDHDHPHDHEPEPVHDSPHSASTGVHSHGGRSHSHAVPNGPLGWRTLAGMGVAGGLVPSPSALIVLLGATALGRAWFGVVLVLCYGIGMAVTLTAAGLLLLRAQAVLDRRGWTLGRGRNGRDLGRLLPVVTAAIVVLVGCGLVARGIVTGQGLF